jgi:hypothetical protein
VFGGDDPLPSIVFQVSLSFRPVCNGEVQRIDILVGVKLFSISRQSKTLSYIPANESLVESHHRLVSRVAQVRVIQAMKGCNKNQFLLLNDEIGKMEVDPKLYCWKRGEGNLLAYSSALGRKLLRDSKPKVNMVEKRWFGLLPLSYRLRWNNTWHRYRGKKEASFIWAIWNKVMAVNVWRAKANNEIDRGCVLCGDVEKSIPHRF